VCLDPSVSTDDTSNESINFLLTQEFPVKFWSSLLPRTISCTVSEIEEHITSLDGSSKRLGDFFRFWCSLFRLMSSRVSRAFLFSMGCDPSFEIEYILYLK